LVLDISLYKVDADSTRIQYRLKTDSIQIDGGQPLFSINIQAISAPHVVVG